MGSLLASSHSLHPHAVMSSLPPLPIGLAKRVGSLTEHYFQSLADGALCFFYSFFFLMLRNHLSVTSLLSWTNINQIKVSRYL